MARIEAIEQRLVNWARWKLSRGSQGSLGYAAVDLTKLADMDTGRGSLYASAAVPISAVEAAETDDGVQRLPSELRRTVEVNYLHPGTQAERARLLCCAEGTIKDRIGRAHRLLSQHFEAVEARRRAERERVEALREANRP